MNNAPCTAVPEPPKQVTVASINADLVMLNDQLTTYLSNFSECVTTISTHLTSGCRLDHNSMRSALGLDRPTETQAVGETGATPPIGTDILLDKYKMNLDVMAEILMALQNLVA